MPESPPTADEDERIETLHSLGILDTPREERFDRITRVGAALFDVPIALVSMVDVNRQWFKACFGLETRETDRSASFCSHAILRDEVLVIEDTLEDERTSDNPLVLGSPYARFYAGQPLKVNGHNMGTLCIIDREPRAFDEGQARLLRDLAYWAELELQLDTTAATT
jgi:GAF domain-containing protein